MLDGIFGTLRASKTAPASPVISRPTNFRHNEHWDYVGNVLKIENLRNTGPKPPTSPVPRNPNYSTLPAIYYQMPSASHENLRTRDHFEYKQKSRSRPHLPYNWIEPANNDVADEQETVSDQESMYAETDYDTVPRKRIVNTLYVDSKNQSKRRRPAVRRNPTGRTRSKSLFDEQAARDEKSCYETPSLRRCPPEPINTPSLEEILTKQETSCTVSNAPAMKEVKQTESSTSLQAEPSQHLGLSYTVTTSIHVNSKRQKIISVQNRCMNLEHRPTFNMQPSQKANDRALFGTTPVSITSIYGCDSTPSSPQVPSTIDQDPSKFFSDPIEISAEPNCISMTPPTSNNSSPMSTFTSRVLNYNDVSQSGSMQGCQSSDMQTRTTHLPSIASSNFSMSSVLEAAIEAEICEEADIIQLENDDLDDIVIHF